MIPVTEISIILLLDGRHVRKPWQPALAGRRDHLEIAGLDQFGIFRRAVHATSTCLPTVAWTESAEDLYVTWSNLPPVNFCSRRNGEIVGSSHIGKAQ